MTNERTKYDTQFKIASVNIDLMIDEKVREALIELYHSARVAIYKIGSQGVGLGK